MSVKVNEEKCIGCSNKKEPVCIKYCPGNLLKLNEKGKPVMRNPDDCWDCMVCIKVCPTQALETVLPYSLASYKASLLPKIEKTKIIWEAKDINGKREVFESPIADSN